MQNHLEEGEDANFGAGLATLLQKFVHLVIKPIFAHTVGFARLQRRHPVFQLLLHLHACSVPFKSCTQVIQLSLCHHSLREDLGSA